MESQEKSKELELSRAIIRRFYQDFHNPGDRDGPNLNVLDEIMHADYTLDRPPTRGRESFKESVAELYAKHPDMKVSFGPMVAESDKVAVRWMVEGKQIRGDGMSIFQLAGGKIVKGWNNPNLEEIRDGGPKK